MKKLFLPLLIVAGVMGASFSATYVLAQPKQSEQSHAVAEHAETKAKPEHGHSATTPADITTSQSLANKQPSKTVDLHSDKASPEQVTIIVGEVLQFNARDGKTHRIALGEGGEEHDHTSSSNSGDFQADEGWRVQFDKPGTYYFHDHLNPNINVLVVAYQPSN